MSIFDGVTTPVANTIPCVCGAPSEAEVWSIRVCYPCAGAWAADDQFSAGVINAALGLSNRIEDFTEANHQRYLAETKRRTMAWLAQRRTARAA